MRISRHVVAGGFITALTVHFALTLLYLMPANPVGLRVRPVVSAYMDPFFAQNWALFAPDPIVDTRELLVSCRIRDEQGKATDTAWANITSPLRDKRADYRVGPANAIERAQMGPLHLVLAPGDPLIERLARDKGKEFAALIADYEQERRHTAERGHRLLRRVASAACDRLYGDGAATEVAMRMLVTESPPFSRRAEPLSSSETRYVDFPWGPYERVALF